MGRTNVDINDELIAEAMARYGLPTKRSAIDLALRRLVADGMTRAEALAMEGAGWEGDLDVVRASEGVETGS